jgi:hypothetical protein
MENESGRKRNALPLACSLSEPDLAKRRRELAENVSGGVLKVDELEDGYAFVFPGSAEWAARLVELVKRGAHLLPFLRIRASLPARPGTGPAEDKGAGGRKRIYRDRAGRAPIRASRITLGRSVSSRGGRNFAGILLLGRSSRLC